MINTHLKESLHKAPGDGDAVGVGNADVHYSPSPRIARLRDRAMTHGAERNMGWLRDYLYMQGWMCSPAAKRKTLPMRNAAALANVIEHMPARLMAGRRAGGRTRQRP